MRRHRRLSGVLITLSLGLLSVGSKAQVALPHTASIYDQKGVSISYPDGWSVAQPTPGSWVILNVPPDQQDTMEPTVRVTIGYLERPDHGDALNQLADYANESDVSSTFLTIGGWPALQRVQFVERRFPGDEGDELFRDLNMVQITTAVAADNLLIRVEGDLPSDAGQDLQNLVLAIGQSLVFSSTGDPAQVQQDLQQLMSAPPRAPAPEGVAELEPFTPLGLPLAPLASSSPIFAPLRLNNGTNGELEVAVSNNGTNIVVVKQSRWITSNDGGQTFPFTGVLNVSDGDSSISFGQSGNFYHSALACFGTSCQPPCPGASPSGTPPSTSTCVEVAASTTNGRTFGPLVNAAVCPNSGANACSLDQEHIAADPVNAGSGGADLVYAAIRNCQGSCGLNGAFVTCSPDSGATWAPLLALEKGSDFPRVAVGRDGFFYVVYEIGGNLKVDKFNSCTTSAAQMTRPSASFPAKAGAFNKFAGCQVANGFGGLDRCNNGNTLSGPTVTVDDTNANHVYVAWANNTASNNEKVVVADSTNGGLNWRSPVTISSAVTARRYHPWSCATGGNAFVSWYDRRAATAANNDLTDYFAASAGLSSGNLVANNDEFQISTASDAQCTLWPRGVRSIFDSENCSVQPQLAGFCKLTPLPNPDTSSNQRCDFAGPDATVCPANPAGPETCQLGNFGQAVKYGDYNGNACVLGRLYTVFASSAGLLNVRSFFQSFVVSSTPTTLAYNGATSSDYHDATILSAVLTLSGTPAGVSGQTITFSVGTQSCPGVTNTAGFASCTLTPNQVPGPYTVTASFAGAGNFQASTAFTGFTITKEETMLSYTGDTVIADNTTAHMKGVLLEDGTVPISGRSVVFTLGTGAIAQTCSGTTDATGTATCSILVNQPLGPGVVSDKFAGDDFYLASSASANTILFAFPDHGAFVLGDQTATVGQGATFWSATWSSQNVLSGGSASDSFKGFASAVSTNAPVCGDTWTSRPGNSSDPPATLPSFMGVVVSTAVSKSGPSLSGNVPAIVVVQTNPGYAPGPGHPGTGTVIAVYCH